MKSDINRDAQRVIDSLIRQRLYEAHRGKGRKNLTVEEAWQDLMVVLFANLIRLQYRKVAAMWGGEQFFLKLARALKTQKTALDKRQLFILDHPELRSLSHAEAVKFLRAHGISISVQNYASLVKRLGLTGQGGKRTNSAFPFSEKRRDGSRHEEKTHRKGSRYRRDRRKSGTSSRRPFQ